MKTSTLLSSILLFATVLCGSAFAGNEVGATFVGQEGGKEIASMKGNLAENNLSCKDGQPCQNLFDKVHDSAQGSFTGTFFGEIVDADTQVVRVAEFSTGTLYIGDQTYRMIFEIDGDSVGMIWVDPAAKIDSELPIPTDDL